MTAHVFMQIDANHTSLSEEHERLQRFGELAAGRRVPGRGGDGWLHQNQGCCLTLGEDSEAATFVCSHGDERPSWSLACGQEGL
jgi:hypothetical protein